jgi:hypothetical protein
MKTIFLILALTDLSIAFSQADCRDADHTVYAKTVSEGIKLAKMTIPSGYVDNSKCAAVLVDCDNGFNISDDGQHCVDKSRDLQGEVTVTLSIRKNL